MAELTAGGPTTVWDGLTPVQYPVFEVGGGRRAQAGKVLEEAAELAVAAKACAGAPGDPAARGAMLGEMADLVQAMVNLKHSFGVADRELEEAAYDCWGRNRDRGRF